MSLNLGEEKYLSLLQTSLSHAWLAWPPRPQALGPSLRAWRCDETTLAIMRTLLLSMHDIYRYRSQFVQELKV